MPSISKGLNLVWSVYGFAIVMFVVALIPGVNLVYSGHGGPAWFLVPFAFPVSVLRLYLYYRREPLANKASARRFCVFSVAAYFPISLLACFLAALSIEKSLGLPVSVLFFWGLFTFPVGLVFSWKFFVA